MIWQTIGRTLNIIYYIPNVSIEHMHFLFGKGKKSDYELTNARKRGYEFLLSYDDFKRLSIKNCIYCGIKPSNKFHAKNAYGYCTFNGIDRVNNKKGYTLKNSVTCCPIVIMLKKFNSKAV